MIFSKGQIPAICKDTQKVLLPFLQNNAQWTGLQEE